MFQKLLPLEKIRLSLARVKRRLRLVTYLGQLRRQVFIESVSED